MDYRGDRGSYGGGHRGGGGYRDRYEGGRGRRDRDDRGGGGGGGGAGHLARIHGTEEDRVNCPFYFKIGACRHGDRCSRAHNRPLFSQTLLIKQLYNNPAAKTAGNPNAPVPDARQTEDEFEDFYIEVFQELAKFGEVEDLVVCDNLGDHLVGNVYAKFYDEEDVAACIQGLYGRYYNKHLLQVEFSPVTDFRESRCRQYDESRCARGGFCNFMHIKRVPREIKRELMKTQPQQGLRSGGAGGGGGGGRDYHRRESSSGRRRRSPSPYGGGGGSRPSSGRRERDRGGSSSRRDRERSDRGGERDRDRGERDYAAPRERGPEGSGEGVAEPAPRRRGGRSSDRERRRQRRREREGATESGATDADAAAAAAAEGADVASGAVAPGTAAAEGQAPPGAAAPAPPQTSAY